MITERIALICTCTQVFTKAKQYFNVSALFFSTVEESSQPTKHANKILVLIFKTYESHNLCLMHTGIKSVNVYYCN